MKAGVHRTLVGEVVARLHYQETGLNLEKGVCARGPRIVLEWCSVFLCILHCCMAMGRLQVALIEGRVGHLPKDNATTVQHVVYRARTGARLASSAAPDGEETQVLLLTWEEIMPLCMPRRMEWLN